MLPQASESAEKKKSVRSPRRTSCLLTKMTALLNVALVIGLWLVVASSPIIFLIPKSSRSTVWMPQLVIFNNLNLFIAVCEIILGSHITHIQEEYKALRERYKGKEHEACLSYLTAPLSISQCLHWKTWSKMWSTYSLYDPSYQNQESLGFFIDVGNGYFTILPGIMINYSLVYPHRLSYLLVGCVGLASYWQILYGTIIYLLSFMFNRRYKGKHFLEVFSFVFVSNAFWLWGPSIGIYYCVCILRDGNSNMS